MITSLCSNVASAEHTDKELLSHGMWQDPSTGLIWMRCSLGQTWTGMDCKGDGEKYTWSEAMKAADNFSYENKKWYLPTKDELESISLINEEGYVNSNIFFNPKSDVSGAFWTSSIGKYQDSRVFVNFVYGTTQYGSSDSWYVRLVSASSNVRQAFANKKEAEYKARVKREEAEQQNRVKREEAEQQAIIKREEARLKREAALSPQAMYLQAGKYDRNGQKYDAIRLYELLVDKYPNNPLAIQATNRLVAMRADGEAADRLRAETNRAIDAANQQQSQSSAECRRRKEAYANSCGSDSYCYARAKSICSE